ncbi:DUF317 domain-containing protein [Streptomyces sp. NPDC096068]|uniref:DUF317 domain-containing protein n=1 Tax=Streptomyces sp. NPDC096068 TaxID=3155424 RepID=UPI0033257E4F
MWPTARDTLLYASPNGLCGGEWTRAARPFERGDLPVAWQISARPRPGSTLSEWNAYLTTDVPHEAPAGFPLALGARTEADRSEAGRRVARNFGKFSGKPAARDRLRPDSAGQIQPPERPLPAPSFLTENSP